MIPSEFQIQGCTWRVRWRDIADPTWAAEKCWGMTYFEATGPEIHLDVSLRADPTKLREIWIHELLHACFPSLKKVDEKLEEKIVQQTAPLLASVLNQFGWDAV